MNPEELEDLVARAEAAIPKLEQLLNTLRDEWPGQDAIDKLARGIEQWPGADAVDKLDMATRRYRNQGN